MAVDVAFVPCRTRSAEMEISLILKSVGLNTIDRFWVAPSSDNTECSWGSYSPESNCLYLQKFIDVSKKSFGISVGVAGEINDWTDLFASPTSCSEVSGAPLWWFPIDG